VVEHRCEKIAAADDEVNDFNDLPGFEGQEQSGRKTVDEQPVKDDMGMIAPDNHSVSSGPTSGGRSAIGISSVIGLP
jgi:hypothetical protein